MSDRPGAELYRTHRRDFAPSDVTQVDSLPVTTVARTIRDCMTTGTDPRQLRLAIDPVEGLRAPVLRRSM